MRYAVVAAVLVLLAAVLVKTVRVESDFTAFLPDSTTAEQRLLVAQLRDGLVSRMMLVSLEGAEPEVLARASRKLATELAKAPEFAFVANGGTLAAPGLQEVLLRHRYALGPGMGPDRFTAEGLRAALEERLAELASPVGGPGRGLLPRDPTGEFAALARLLAPETQPGLRHGVWFTKEGRGALLVAQTRAPGFDSVAQAVAMARVRDAVKAVEPRATATLSGPGVFAAESHRLIERDALWLSAASIAAVVALLAFVYRSAPALFLLAVPALLGLAAGVLAVQVGFGSVHAITLGFGATLIGEAADYPNYLILQSQEGAAPGAVERVGGTLAIAVLTTVASALALALSSFKGLAQLGVLTMVGILVAGIATRWLVPWLARGKLPVASRIPLPPITVAAGSRGARGLSAAAAIAAVAGLAVTHPAWWERDLASISPIPVELRLRDTQLREEIGAPEVSFLIAARGATRDAALAAAARTLPGLDAWRASGLIRGYDSPAVLAPPPELQRERLAAIPEPGVLRANLRKALQDLPFRPDLFAPFLEEAERARTGPVLQVADYAGTPLGAKLAALVVELDGTWFALTPLIGVRDARALEAAIATPQGAGASLVDLKRVSTDMVEGYRGETLRQVALGAALIALLLAFGLRSGWRAARILAPNFAAIAVCVGVLVAFGARISIFHLVALLLVLGAGLNYALFLEAASRAPDDPRHVRQALAVCIATTLFTFGILSFSATPVLHAIGSTVALGSVLALAFAAAWARAPAPAA